MNAERNKGYAEGLSRLIQVETVSETGKENIEKFERFHEVLKESFPAFFAAASVEDFNGSLLLRWPGKDAQKEPLLLMSHHDVVEATGKWKYPPFSGAIAEGKVWGRGTLDTKGNLWAILQAAEELAAEGYVPERDVYVESACTEETDGAGADAISKELKKRGIHFCMSLDEGGMMLHDPIGGADGTFAMIGVGEKSYADVRFVARSEGGHASTPGKNTPLVRLGRFMAAAEQRELFEAELSPVIREMFRRMAPYTKGAMRVAFSHPEKSSPLLCKIMPALSATAGALVKTTLAFTMSKGSEGHNVLPQEAWVIGNIRFSHHQGRKSSLRAVRKLAAKFGVEMKVLEAGIESPLTDYNGKPFRLVEQAVEELFPGVRPVPYIMTGTSDSRFFCRVCDHCIRFAPFLIDHAQLDSIHGNNENVDVDTLAGAVDFYKYIIRRCGKL